MPRLIVFTLETRCLRIKHWTPLHFGAEKGDIDLFQLLLEQSTPTLDINAVDRERCTALFRAAKVGDAKIVELLLRSNADPNITNTDGIDFVF